ncbi:MAG: DUF948 domain-containing protein [Gloeobacterales cyanobacterium]
MDSQFWLGISAGLLGAALLALVLALLPLLSQLTRTARSAERLLDLVERELPPILDSLQQTTAEVTDISQEVGGGLKRVNQTVDAVGTSMGVFQAGVSQVSVSTKAWAAGAKAAWKTLKQGKTD